MVENTGTTHLPCKTTVSLVEQATLFSDISYSLRPRGSRKYWYPTHREGTGDSEAGGFVEPNCDFPKIREGAGCNYPWERCGF